MVWVGLLVARRQNVFKKLCSQRSNLGSSLVRSFLVLALSPQPTLILQNKATFGEVWGQHWAAAHFRHDLYSELLWNKLVTPSLSHSAPEWEESQ